MKTKAEFEAQFDALLDMNDPQFAEKLVDAIGAEPGETIVFHGPQFERVDGVDVPAIDTDTFRFLPGMSEAALKAHGCSKWDEPDKDGNVLWLYPYQWYNFIPEGFPVVDINGEHELFRRGVTDDDMRYGALAYGFLRKAVSA